MLLVPALITRRRRRVPCQLPQAARHGQALCHLSRHISQCYPPRTSCSRQGRATSISNRSQAKLCLHCAAPSGQHPEWLCPCSLLSHTLSQDQQTTTDKARKCWRMSRYTRCNSSTKLSTCLCCCRCTSPRFSRRLPRFHRRSTLTTSLMCSHHPNVQNMVEVPQVQFPDQVEDVPAVMQ